MHPLRASTGDGPAELAGTFEDFTLEELFALFTATGQSGAVFFGEPAGATLWIDDGRLCYGSSPGSVEPRRLLERRGLVTGAQYDGAVAATGDGAPLHETLTDLFEIDPDRIAAIAREQIVTTTFEIVVVGAASFEFHAGVPDPLGVAVRMEHAEVLDEAERRRDEWRRIAELIPSTGIVAALSPTLPDERSGITLTAEEWQILAQLDGRRSAAEVIENLGQSAFEVCGVLYDLLAAGTAVVVGTAETEAVS